MTPAGALLADLRSRGIELETNGTQLRWRLAFLVTGPLAGRIQSERAGLIELLTGPDCVERCPRCRWPLDSTQRCPKCFDRLCVDCGKPTGSYFIMRCVICGRLFEDRTCLDAEPKPIGQGIEPKGSGT
jgi:hypothetical protein